MNWDAVVFTNNAPSPPHPGGVGHIARRCGLQPLCPL
jgi:hypothetical protein